MFEVKVFDNSGRSIDFFYIDQNPEKNSPARYFTHCVKILINMLGGGGEINKILSSSNVKPHTEFARQGSLLMFWTLLFKHPTFVQQKENKDDVNYQTFQKMSYLLQKDFRDTSSHFPFMELISQLSVEGVQRVEFSNDYTENYEKLYRCNFPDDSIPVEYLCALTQQLMDQPCYDKRDPEKIYDRNKLNIYVDTNGKNPFTTLAFTMDKVVIKIDLGQKIQDFVAKVTLIFNKFPNTYNQEYQKRKEQISGPETYASFKVKIEKEQAESNQNQDTNSNLSLDFKNSNPQKLYQNACQDFKEKNYRRAVGYLGLAIEKFEQKKGKYSKECFTCYSTLVSCYREQKDYDKAIACAELTIKDFYGRVDSLDSVVKKYHECLKLQGWEPGFIYDKAVTNYKSKNFYLAIQILVYVTENCKEDKKLKASCHSTLASCYRELGSVGTAIEHCKEALSLRKTLNDDAKLISDTENKLEALNKLLSNQENNNNAGPGNR